MRRSLVTGGNSGIGKEIARGLVAQGLEVLIGVRDFQAGAVVADQIGATPVYCDLEGEWNDIHIPPEASEVEVLVNNAGVLFDEPLLSKKARFDECIDVMLRGPYRLMKAAVPFIFSPFCICV